MLNVGSSSSELLRSEERSLSHQPPFLLVGKEGRLALILLAPSFCSVSMGISSFLLIFTPILEMEPRALYMLSKYSTTELYSQTFFYFETRSLQLFRLALNWFC